ncbi:hypothetical protein ACFVH0_15135 [Streptomyces sp. NPDC127117]|uniref:hypothetical protein n=1 Tax=Streptomyces sp. NPDC127117 TaxID=3345368 RepID=UPI003645F2E0
MRSADGWCDGTWTSIGSTARASRSAGGAVTGAEAEGSRVIHTNHPLAGTDIDPGAPAELRAEGRVQDSEARLRVLEGQLPRDRTVRDAGPLADESVPVCMARVPGRPLRTFAAVSFQPSRYPPAGLRPGLPGTARWTEPGWSGGPS